MNAETFFCKIRNFVLSRSAMTCIRIVRGAFLVSVRIRIIKHSIETIFQTSLILNFIKKFQVRDFLRYIKYINIKFQQFQLTRRMPRF